MAVRGENNACSIKDVCDALERSHGIVSKAAKILSVGRDTIYRRIREDKELKEYLDSLRLTADDDLLDDSFIALRYNLNNYKKYPRIALDAAKFVIEKIGHKRSWDNNKSNQSINQDFVNKFESISSQLSDLQEVDVSEEAIDV